MNLPSQASRDACHTSTPTTGSIAHIDTKGRWNPPTPRKLPECRVNSSLVNVINESPFETVNLSENIRKYQCNGRLRDI